MMLSFRIYIIQRVIGLRRPGRFVGHKLFHRLNCQLMILLGLLFWCNLFAGNCEFIENRAAKIGGARSIDGNTCLNCTSPKTYQTSLAWVRKHIVASFISGYLLSFCNASITQMCNQEFICIST